MKNNITPQEALNNLYTASRLANLKADEHIACQISKDILEKLVNPAPVANPSVQDEK